MDSNTVESLDVESLTSLVSSGNIREAQAFSIPLWVKILQLPANIILSPIRITRKFLFDI